MDMGMQPGSDPGMQDPSMMGGADMQDPNMMGGADMQDPNMTGDDSMGDPSMGGDPNAIGGEEQPNQFDSNFDAGVEADEDTDPKRYIQQLTGKLSQSLNSYNEENGDDSGLSKYVGKMILKQAAKALDEKGRKDLIKAINTADSSDDEDEEELDDTDDIDDEIGDDTDQQGGDMPDDSMDSEMPEEQPMQENVITKKQLKALRESIAMELVNNGDNEIIGNQNIKKYKSKSPFTGKVINK